MTTRHVLITGGAGFIGSHVADELLAHGYRVRALDNLTPQVHGEERRRPAYLARDVELVVGDVRDGEACKRALEGVDAVFHFAAAVGVGQSMYDVAHYTSVNNVGTAVLMECVFQRSKPLERLVVASSMSVYGEGLVRAPNGTTYEVGMRSLDRLKRGEWEPNEVLGAKAVGSNGSNGRSGVPPFARSDAARVDGLVPVPTPESKTVSLASVYALSKYDQEQMCLMLGRAYGIPTVALRFFNVYGSRQALSNPYTGVLAIFASRLLNGNRPLVFEDGKQQRDFVDVKDVARACRLSLERREADGRVLNVGSGRPRTIEEVALRMAKVLGKTQLTPEITGKYRMGDVRHCFADITEARRVLGYEPKEGFDDSLPQLADWLKTQVGQVKDRSNEARAELESRGLSL